MKTISGYKNQSAENTNYIYKQAYLRLRFFSSCKKKERTAESISGNHTGVVLPIEIAPRSGQNGALSRTVDNPHCD